MSQLLSLPWYLYVVPVCAVVAAVVVSRLLKISQLASLIGTFLPLGLPYTQLSLASESFGPQSSLSKPHMQILSGWGVMLACGVGWVLLRAIVRTSRGPLGLLRLGYSALLTAAVVVVVLLISKPEILSTYAPAWRESAGGFLLGATLLGVVLAFIRLFKSAAFLVLCSVASVILASQVFFSKMPYDLGRDEISKIEKVLPDSLPKGFVGTGVERLVRATSSTRSVLQSASSDDVDS
jgi:hypothetical protein